jgi:hypothetical protein
MRICLLYDEGTEPKGVLTVTGGFKSMSPEAVISDASSKSWNSLLGMVL